MNNLFNTLMGETAIPGGNGQNMNEMMSRLRSDPVSVLRNAGYTVPDNMVNDPKATVMHLIQSGQVNSPMMQKIQPMLNMLGMR